MEIFKNDFNHHSLITNNNLSKMQSWYYITVKQKVTKKDVVVLNLTINNINLLMFTKIENTELETLIYDQRVSLFSILEIINFDKSTLYETICIINYEYDTNIYK